MKLKIGDREIGEGCSPYIIAEVGSNWRDLSDCMKSIVAAKQSGADAVKFQLFTDQELFGMDRPDHTDFKFNLDPEWLPKLKEKADAVGIDFMCTAFSPEGYEIVDPYVKMHKVASAECTHMRILEKLHYLGKPVILSTGAKGVEDIKMSLRVLKPMPTIGSVETAIENGMRQVPVVLMYCVAAYPANEVDLHVIEKLKDEFDVPVGYSDHSTDVLTIPVMATPCAVLEKHFTVLPDVQTPDRPHSITPEQFKKMVDRIRTPKSWHDSVIGPTPDERPMVIRHNRRLIATKDLHPGDQLQEGVNFGIYRSLKDDTRAASPFMIDQFIGKRVKCEIKAGDGLWIDDLEA